MAKFLLFCSSPYTRLFGNSRIVWNIFNYLTIPFFLLLLFLFLYFPQLHIPTMPTWKSLLSVLALASTAISCAHHDDNAEVVPEHEREELLKKWDQEVCSNSTQPNPTTNPVSNPSFFVIVVLLR